MKFAAVFAQIIGLTLYRYDVDEGWINVYKSAAAVADVTHLKVIIQAIMDIDLDDYVSSYMNFGASVEVVFVKK